MCVNKQNYDVLYNLIFWITYLKFPWRVGEVLLQDLFLKKKKIQ